MDEMCERGLHAFCTVRGLTWSSTYLDFDEFLQPVHDENVLVARLWVLLDDGFVAGPHEPVDKRLLGRRWVVQVPEHDRRALDPEFAGLVVAFNLGALDRNEPGLVAGQQTSGGAEPDVIWTGRAYHRRRLCQSVALSYRPTGKDGLQIVCSLLSQWCRSSEQASDRRQVVLVHSAL